MRSRYAAYFFRFTVYLVETTHPDTRTPNLKQELEEMAPTINWKFLTVVQTSKGGKDDKVGKVEFVAEYFIEGEKGEIHETSRFRRYKGAWKYYDEKG